MASEIRVDTLKTSGGIGTATYSSSRWNFTDNISAPNFVGNVIGNVTGNVAKADAATILSPRTSSPYTTIDTQGSYIHWNRKSGDGATWLINQRGAGVGGFVFADSTSNALNVTGGTVGLTTTLVINASGDVTPTGDFIGRLTNTMLTGTNTTELIRGNMANNDYFRILVGGTATDAGYVEIATADGGNEPIYVRQYTGVFSTLQRTATLLDGSGDTRFPGTVYATSFSAISDATFNGDLRVIGNITATGTVKSSSDIKLKTNIKTIDNALDKVLNLRGVEYDRLDINEHQIGVIAQEVEKVIPEVVYGEETKTVAYGNLVGVLIEAIKEQQSQINNLSKELENLKNK